ncbi:hypothetical protein TNCV_2437301 [Trichonephila clavipes]|nr:hypothetical protein TNCV_2437301 [Trichonephila clavipes]
MKRTKRTFRLKSENDDTFEPWLDIELRRRPPHFILESMNTHFCTLLLLDGKCGPYGYRCSDNLSQSD